MRRLLVQRLLHVIPVLVLVSLGTLVLLDLTPGDPAAALLGPTASSQQIKAIDHQLGLDQPFFDRYVHWIGHVMTGNFGTSLRSNQPVLDAIRQAVPVTLELALLGLLFALILAVPLGVYTAYRAEGLADRFTKLGTSAFISSPPFLTALVLVYLFAIKVNLFPATGWSNLSDGLGPNLRGAFLPAFTLALGETAIFARTLRSDMVGTLQQDYILLARAKGLGVRYILLHHALRPSSFSLITLAGLSLGRLIGGAVIVEQVFALPGIGQLLIQSIITKDYAMVQGITMFIAIGYVLINTLVDVAYSYLDPRVRMARA